MLYAAGELDYPLEFLRAAFEARAAALAGYEPSLENCAACGKAPVSPYFYPEFGEIVCNNCRNCKSPGEALPCPEPVYNAFKHFVSAPIKQLL